MNGTSSPVDIDGFRLSMRAAGIEEIVEPTLSLFVDESRKLFTALEESCTAGDAESMRRAAHTLKASSANVHALELSRQIEEIESTAGDGNLTGATSLMVGARREYSSVLDYLTEHGFGS